MLKTVLILGSGGFIGSNLRYFTGKFVHKLSGTSFPVGTFAVNIIGSLLFGLLFFISTENENITDQTKLFLGTGLLGAFTTFSTFSYETVSLFRQGMGVHAGLNILLNLVLGIGGVLAGMGIGRLIMGR